MKPVFASVFNLKTTLYFLIPVLLFSCSKEHSIETGGINSATGTYEFTEGGTVYRGNIDSTYTKEGNSVNELHIIGHPSGGGDEFHLILFSDGLFDVGTYEASAFNSAFDYGSLPLLLYTAGQTIGDFEVNLTTSESNLITGTFSGKALKNGTDLVDITAGSFKMNIPEKEIKPTSEGVLGNESGMCLPVQVSGSYRQGTPLNISNTIQIQANVSLPGTYSIFTDPINGIVFKASGTFSSTGQITVTLKGTGTPTTPGDQDFVVHFGNSSCGFKINIIPQAAASNDYYPTSLGSWWKFSNNAGDAYYFKVTNQPFSFGGNTYTVIGEFSNLDDTNFDVGNYLRKDAGNYYSLIDYSTYSLSDQPQLQETIALKDNVAQGASWNGPNFDLEVSNTTLTANFKYTILEKAVPATVSGFDFPDVIKVSSEIVVNGTSTGQMQEFWYAKNVGLVYVKDFSGAIWQVIEYQVL